MKTFYSLILFLCSLSAFAYQPIVKYTVSMPDPSSHRFQTEFKVDGVLSDTVYVRMPKWTPGYYQLMDFAADVMNVSVKGSQGETMTVVKSDANTWKITTYRKSFKVSYDVLANQSFVARSFLDSTHAYIVPANNFMYVVGALDAPVTLEIRRNAAWKNTATGLDLVAGTTNIFTAPNYDIFYDCPVLIGNLASLPSFEVNGIKHHFTGYEMGSFDGATMMKNIKRFVEAATTLIGEVPYKEYTFIGIGEGRGGIEHLNNTTISFNGSHLKSEADINDMILYLGHEYFHNINVKRIRPVELGPFDYNKENRTTQLWISEGLTMYYQYVLCNHAGLLDEKGFLANFEGHINSVQNNPARLVQSMTQSSYSTWEDGPFTKPGQTISYYEKGPINGMIIDLAIRRATQSKKSLNDVMRFIYQTYYKQLKRGFTDAEFQQACEQIAGVSLAKEFEYITTTKDIQYADYLSYVGLELVDVSTPGKKAIKYSLRRSATISAEQKAALKAWVND